MTASIDSLQFRDAMARLGASVTIVTTNGPAGMHGLTASAVCSVTDNPPTLIVCVNRHAAAHDLIARNGVMCVNILASEQRALADSFGRPGQSTAQKFADGDWRSMATGAPALDEAAVNLDCRVVESRSVGTHTVFFGQVEAIRLADDPAGLFYFDRTYFSLDRLTRTLGLPRI